MFGHFIEEYIDHSGKHPAKMMFNPLTKQMKLHANYSMRFGSHPSDNRNVFEDCAEAAAVPVDDAFGSGCGAAVGNCMHVANLGCVLMTALACVQPW